MTEELLKAGNIREAKSIAEKIHPNPTEYSPLQSAIIQVVADIVGTGAQENALAIVDLIENEAKRSWGLSVIAESFAKAGRLDKALETARKVKDEILSPITLAQVAGEFTRKGRNDVALSLLNEALGAAKWINDKQSLEKIHHYLIPELAVSGMIDEALALAESFIDRPLFEQGDGIDSIAKAMAETGKPGEALNLLRSYGRKIPFPHDSVVTIVEKLAHAGDTHEVFAIRNDIPFPAAVDGAIVEGLLKAGRVDDALAVAQNIKDKHVRREAFSEIAEFLLRSGSYKQARLVADRCPSHLQRMFLYFEIFNELSFRRNPQLRAQVKNYRLINVP
jgi:tetratricopeptide (TPR) repeat protein